MSSPSLQPILDECRVAIEDKRFTRVRNWKAERPGRKVMGYFPVFAPRELVEGAGALPLGLHGGGQQVELMFADSRIQSFVCSISRTTLELGLIGNLDLLDGMFFTNICDVARNLSGVWSRNFPAQKTVFLHLPMHPPGDTSLRYLTKELDRVYAQVSGMVGNGHSREELRRAIEAGNRNRVLQSKLEAIHRTEPWKLSLPAIVQLRRIGTQLTLGQHNAMLGDALERLKSSGARPRDGIRVVVEGAFCEQPPLELLEVLEESGCFVVGDDFARGLRPESAPIVLEDGADPIEALARWYVFSSGTLSVRHATPQRREDYLFGNLRTCSAQGVIFLNAKFCEPALYDYVVFKNALERVGGVPFLTLEFEEKQSTFENLRMQVETFVESILFA